MTEIELTRRERKKEETRKRIFKAAIKLFRDKGFEATTVDEITERADVAKGTFFNYFPKKDAVLGYLAEEQWLDVEEQARVLITSDRPAREILVEILCTAAAIYEEDRDLSRWVMLEWMKRAFQPTEDVHRRVDELLVRVVERGQARGEIRADLNPERVQSVLGSVYMGALFMWLHCSPEGVPELDAELRARLNLVFDGACVR